MDNNFLLFGYGNPDRGDDGAAYHLFKVLFHQTGKEGADIFSTDVIPLTDFVDVIFNFQLLPEYTDIVAQYEKVVFIDAHTAEIEEELKLVELKPQFENSPLTHHFSPSSCLALAKSITGKAPRAWLLSIRGYEFGFSQHLSERTSGLVSCALNILKAEFFELL